MDSLSGLLSQIKNNMQKTMVILNETLKLHLDRADETRESRFNKVTQMLSLVHAIVNSGTFEEQ